MADVTSLMFGEEDSNDDVAQERLESNEVSPAQAVHDTSEQVPQHEEDVEWEQNESEVNMFTRILNIEEILEEDRPEWDDDDPEACDEQSEYNVSRHLPGVMEFLVILC